MERQRETIVIEKPETTKEHARYAWDGLKMVVGSSAVLAWRGAKAAYEKAREMIKNRKGNVNGDGDRTEGAA